MFLKITLQLLLALLVLAHPVFADDSTKTSSDPVDISTKILGGTESKSGDWPWMAALLNTKILDNPDISNPLYWARYCSGVLIDDTWVLTAGHCVNGLTPGNIEVAVGVYDLKNFSGSPILVKSIRLHPGYNATNLTNDIALIELSQASDQPTIPLFSGRSIEDAPVSLLGRMLTALGWGKADGTDFWYYPERLRQVDLPVVANSYCNDIYPYPLVPLSASQFCAGWYVGKDVCSGDSGGPLVTLIDGRWTHVGLVSYGTSCKDYFGWYGVYTRTSAFVDFIKGYVPGARFTGKPPLPWMILLIH